MIVRQRALARLGLRHGDPVRGGEAIERLGRLRVMHSAAGDHQWRFGVAQQIRRRRQFAGVRPDPADMPKSRGEKLFGIIERLRLHVLAQRQGHRAALRRIGQHRQRARQCREDLLGPRDAIEVARHRAEAVVRRYRAVAEALHLLQHRVGPARGEHVAWQQQHRQPVDMRHRRRGDHVGGARSDRRGAGHHPPSVHRLGVADRRQRHRLLVVRAIGRQVVAMRRQSLADAGNIAVAEDRPYAAEQRDRAAFAFGALRRQIAHQRLRHGQSDRGHSCLLPTGVLRCYCPMPEQGRGGRHDADHCRDRCRPHRQHPRAQHRRA